MRRAATDVRRLHLDGILAALTLVRLPPGLAPTEGRIGDERNRPTPGLRQPKN